MAVNEKGIDENDRLELHEVVCERGTYVVRIAKLEYTSNVSAGTWSSHRPGAEQIQYGILVSADDVDELMDVAGAILKACAKIYREEVPKR